VHKKEPMMSRANNPLNISKRAATIAATANTMSKVCEHVFVGGCLAAANRTLVRTNRITHILKMFSDSDLLSPPVRHPGVEYCVVPTQDVPTFPIDLYFAQCIRFIQHAIRRNGVLLIHCHAGVSRAATIALLHLIIDERLTLNDAWAKLKRARPVVNPNPGFWAILRAFEVRVNSLQEEAKNSKDNPKSKNDDPNSKNDDPKSKNSNSLRLRIPRTTS
jgi:predicted protein tyrosine phosphatase